MTPPEKLQAAFMADDPTGVKVAIQSAIDADLDAAELLRSQKWYFRPWLLLQASAAQHAFAVWCMEHTRDDNPVIYKEAKEKQGDWQEAMEAARLMAVAEEQTTGSPKAAREAQQDYLIAAFLKAHHPDLSGSITAR